MTNGQIKSLQAIESQYKFLPMKWIQFEFVSRRLNIPVIEQT